MERNDLHAYFVLYRERSKGNPRRHVRACAMPAPYVDENNNRHNGMFRKHIKEKKNVIITDDKN